VRVRWWLYAHTSVGVAAVVGEGGAEELVGVGHSAKPGFEGTPT
jgi:hypothetical protein